MSIKAPSTATQTVMSVTSPGMSVDGVIVDAAYIIAGFALLMGGGEGLVQGAIRISEAQYSTFACRIHSGCRGNFSSRIGGRFGGSFE